VPTLTKEVDDVLGGEEAWKNVDSTAGAVLQAAACALRVGAHALLSSSFFAIVMPAHSERLQPAAQSASMSAPSSCKCRSARATSQ
jgi:hypothetical protein